MIPLRKQLEWMEQECLKKENLICDAFESGEKIGSEKLTNLQHDLRMACAVYDTVKASLEGWEFYEDWNSL